MNNTFMANPDKVERKWYVVDATGYTLGRLSSEIAKILRGKNKAVFTPHIDTGDYVIVVNAEKIKVTGKKLAMIIYLLHRLKCQNFWFLSCMFVIRSSVYK